MIDAKTRWMMPDLFGLPALSFVQALVLLALSNMLFGDKINIK